MKRKCPKYHSVLKMNFLSNTVNLFIILLISILNLNDAIRVETSLGKIKGSVSRIGDVDTYDEVRVHQFLGVPFAKPPTGNLRFKKPEPVEAWSGTLECTELKPACTQFTPSPFPWYTDDQENISEDCLYLNIYAPLNASAENKRAVLFWIYGGGFFIGSNRQTIYDGIALAGMGDIIVVTVNYRLGSLGFWFSNTDDAPGNVGIWDMLTALKWVNEHIESFGGDKSRITIAGESAGAISVGLLSVSPLARGLYVRQIMESGSPAYTLGDNNNGTLERSIQVASRVGCINESVTLIQNPEQVTECMRGIDALTLIKEEGKLNPGSSRSFLPRFGDELIPKNPRLAVRDGDFQNNDNLIGNNKNEGSFQLTTGNPDLFGFFGKKDTNISKAIAAELLNKIFRTFPNTDAVVNHYLPDNDDYIPRMQVADASGDFTLICPTVFFAEKFAEMNNSVYFYLFDHRPRNSPWEEWMGVVHFEEVQYVFGVPIQIPSRYRKIDRSITRRMIQHWSNFVKNGKPKDYWPLYSKDNPTFFYYNTAENQEEGMGPHKDNCDFFRPYFDM